MIHNTRFNPTINGPLHLGHLYVLLINFFEARNSGGKFILRFDDTQLGWNYRLGPVKVANFKAGLVHDLDWLGIQPDLYESQAERMEEVERLMRDIFHYDPAPEQYAPDFSSATLAGCIHHFYPYTDRLTSEKVIFDMLDGITWLIRGMDLITEDCLYIHYCHKFNISIPRRDYVPRLYCGKDISKTAGQFKLEDYRRQGYSPDELLAQLALDCLDKPGWQFDHIKPVPTLGSWASEALS